MSARNEPGPQVTLTLPIGSVIPSSEDGDPAKPGRIGVWRSASAGTSLFFGFFSVWFLGIASPLRPLKI